MSFRLLDEQIPDETPWRDEEFLWWAYHERDLSPRTIAYELGVEKSRVTIHMDRLGVLKPWTHKPTLEQLHVQRGLSADEIAEQDGFDCTPTTVRKYLSEYDLSDEENVYYDRFAALEA